MPFKKHQPQRSKELTNSDFIDTVNSELWLGELININFIRFISDIFPTIFPNLTTIMKATKIVILTLQYLSNASSNSLETSEYV